MKHTILCTGDWSIEDTLSEMDKENTTDRVDSYTSLILSLFREWHTSKEKSSLSRLTRTEQTVEWRSKS